MADRGSSRIVYSTAAGRVCPDCGAPVPECRCRRDAADAAVPSKLIAKLRMEKKGRSGKTVTVVDGLPHNATFLKELNQALKRACGTGGTVLDGAVELQGDLRERVRDVLLRRGFTVKG